jgi:hypothetical protein
MFCLNFLPSDGEKRFVTLNVEASDNHLVSIYFFYQIGSKKLFAENSQFIVHSYEFTVRPLTYTVSRSIDGLDMPS